MALREDRIKVIPRRKLGPVRRALMKVFRVDRWIYGKPLSTSADQVEQLRREQMSLLLGEFTAYTQLSNDRHIKYADYDSMDEGSPECAAVLSLLAQEASAEDLRTKKVLWVQSEDKELAKNLNRLLRELQVEERAWGTIRNLTKYGDCFMLNLFAKRKDKDDQPTEDVYLRTLQYIYPGRVTRLEGETCLGYRSEDLTQVLPPGNEEGIYAPWDFTHGRLMAFDNESIYGRSICEEVRKIWKMLSILETMVALAHVQRAIDRHLFKINVGNAGEEEAFALIKKVKQMMRRKEYFDPKAQQFKSDFNPTTIQEDIFWPVRPGDTVSGVSVLEGKVPPAGLVDDLNYFRNRLCAGLGVPREYLDGTQQGSVYDSKAALVMQDIHFARKVERTQRAYRDMIYRICQVHLALEGATPKNFEIRMAPLSLISDRLNEDLSQRRVEVCGAMAALAETMGLPKNVWYEYILRTILKEIPPDVLEKLLAGVRKLSSEPELLGVDTGTKAKNGDGNGDKDLKPGDIQHDPKNPISPELPTKMTHDELPAQVKTLFSDLFGAEAAKALEEETYGRSDGDNLADLKKRLKDTKMAFVQSYPQFTELLEAGVKRAVEEEPDEESDEEEQEPS